ncbi:MAG: hypothetical protein PHX60_03975 [Giesbergeria sp.]|uniref:hypothetical protein n=1 Tax=Giesbergeria sp. TaxID=2818473 RepID=UPI002603D4DC|nr:hypothetical protein [Giesbergeria sp.]MDD2608839.1 hypothetical protein [Giesbergeria sp.]
MVVMVMVIAYSKARVNMTILLGCVAIDFFFAPHPREQRLWNTETPASFLLTYPEKSGKNALYLAIAQTLGTVAGIGVSPKTLLPI